MGKYEDDPRTLTSPYFVAACPLDAAWAASRVSNCPRTFLWIACLVKTDLHAPSRLIDANVTACQQHHLEGLPAK